MYHFAAKLGARPDGGGLGLALFWNLLLAVVFALVVVPGTRKQLASTDWPTAAGTITVSEPTSIRKVGAGWHLEYTYTVAGVPLTGTRYAYDPMPIQGRDVDRAIAAFPVGAAVTVWYDPAAPGEAVLRPGLRGCTLWVALFLTCLGGVTFGTAWAVFLFGFGLGVLYWVCDGLLMDPPLWGPLLVWAGVLVVSGWAAGWVSAVAPTLTADDIGRQLLFRPDGPTVAWADVRAVTVAETAAPVTFRVELVRPGEPLTVYTYDDRRDADALAGWLRGRIGVPA